MERKTNTCSFKNTLNRVINTLQRPFGLNREFLPNIVRGHGKLMQGQHIFREVTRSSFVCNLPYNIGNLNFEDAEIDDSKQKLTADLGICHSKNTHLKIKLKLEYILFRQNIYELIMLYYSNIIHKVKTRNYKIHTMHANCKCRRSNNITIKTIIKKNNTIRKKKKLVKEFKSQTTKEDIYPNESVEFIRTPKSPLTRKMNAIRRHVSESVAPPLPPPRTIIDNSKRRRHASGDIISRQSTRTDSMKSLGSTEKPSTMSWFKRRVSKNSLSKEKEYIANQYSRYLPTAIFYNDYAHIYDKLENMNTNKRIQFEKLDIFKVTFGDKLNGDRNLIRNLMKDDTSQLWITYNEVKLCKFVNKMIPHAVTLQESIFELITKEINNLRNLQILNVLYRQDQKLIKCLDPVHHKDLFKYVSELTEISSSLLLKMEDNWYTSKTKPLLQAASTCRLISDHIREHACQIFQSYVKNKNLQMHILNQYKDSIEFSSILCNLENNKQCQLHDLKSYLMMPIQYLTRLPMLVGRVMKHFDILYKHNFENKTKILADRVVVQRSLKILQSVVRKCDESSKDQHLKQLHEISNGLFYPDGTRTIPLISEKRYLVKSGLLKNIIQLEKNKNGLHKSFMTKICSISSRKEPFPEYLHLYLFNDILLITKKLGDKYAYINSSARNSIIASEIKNTFEQVEMNNSKLIVFKIILLESNAVYILGCQSSSERIRWMSSLTPSKLTNNNEKIYELWDQPHYKVNREYLPKDNDELHLEHNDIISLFRKSAEGWYEGEKLSDGTQGWFPSCYVEEVHNQHVYARSLRVRYLSEQSIISDITESTPLL